MGDAVADACTDLADYMARLEQLTPERAEHGMVTAGGRVHAAVSPEPGNGPAIRALMTGHEGVRRLLALLRVWTAGHPGIRFGGSDQCTAKVLDLIPKAAAGLDSEHREVAVWYLTTWINGARVVHGIDEISPWRHLPKPRDGEALPPACPYCNCYQLLADVEARVVACSVPDCWDGLGLHPVASMTTDQSGRPQLEWADGLIEPGLNMEGLPPMTRMMVWPHRAAAAVWSPRRRRWVCTRCGLRVCFTGTVSRHRVTRPLVSTCRMVRRALAWWAHLPPPPHRLMITGGWPYVLPPAIPAAQQRRDFKEQHRMHPWADPDHDVAAGLAAELALIELAARFGGDPWQALLPPADDDDR